MRLFISCGVRALKKVQVSKKLNEIINYNKPILYMGFDMQENNCFESIKCELKNINAPFIEYVESIKELEKKDCYEYSVIFINGENTYKLLKDLKESECYEKLRQYILDDGIVFCISAGAMILGKSINTCKYTDDNFVELSCLTGLNLLNNYSLFCTFANLSEEKKEQEKKNLIELSTNEKVIYLPEEDVIYVENGKYEIIGNEPVCIFDSGSVIKLNSNNNIKEYYMLKNEFQLMDFMDSNVIYGWLDNLNNMHLNNLSDLRKNYKVSSIKETLSCKVGTCLEQSKLEKSFFDRIGVENKLYCYRGYESVVEVNEKVIMHCFLLFKVKDIWYHFEHSNSPKRGIHPYANLTIALEKICEEFKKDNIRILTEIPDIPDGLSFVEFIEYVHKKDFIKLNNK